MTNDEDSSSIIYVGARGSLCFRFLFAKSRLAMLVSGKSPLFLSSLNLSWCSWDKLVGRILQLEQSKSEGLLVISLEVSSSVLMSVEGYLLRNSNTCRLYHRFSTFWESWSCSKVAINRTQWIRMPHVYKRCYKRWGALLRKSMGIV